MLSIVVPIVVVLVIVFALAIWMDSKTRRSRRFPSSGDEQARRTQAGADQRTGRRR